MTERAGRGRDGQRGGAGCLRAGLARILAALIGVVASASPALAAHSSSTRADSAAADAAVAELRNLPLPLRAFPRPITSGKGPPQPLPALELRRQHVYDELHALGPASVIALARALHDSDPRMRRDVAVALDVVGGGWWHFPDGNSKLDLRPALPALLTALRDSDADVRAWAAQDISDMGAAAAMAVPRLRAMLHSTDAESRGSACRALGQIGRPARVALPDLRQAVDDSSPEVRQAARQAIARIDRADALH